MDLPRPTRRTVCVGPVWRRLVVARAVLRATRPVVGRVRRERTRRGHERLRCRAPLELEGLGEAARHDRRDGKRFCSVEFRHYM